MPYRRAPVFLLSPGINTRGTTLPPCWIYSMSRGLVSTNQTFFASEKPDFGYSGAEFPRAYVRIHKPVSTGVEKRTDVLWVKWVNESWVIHESMSQIWKNRSFGRNNKIFQCVHFMIHSDPRNERKIFLRNSWPIFFFKPGPNINTPNVKERLFPHLNLWALRNSITGLSQFTLGAAFKENEDFLRSTPKMYVALFFASYRVLRGRAWELVTNSPGRDFMSE